MEYAAKPCSRIEISSYADKVRAAIGYSGIPQFPILYFAEWFLYDFIPGYSFEIVEQSELPYDQHGLTYPEEKTIVIRNDVYKRAYEGMGRDRMTIAHEVGHLLLHDPRRIVLARSRGLSRPLKAYEDPEWQASAFAGELMIPRIMMRGKTVNEIVSTCGVSQDAAELFVRKNP